MTATSWTTSSLPVTGLTPALRPLFRSVSSLPSSAHRSHRWTVAFGSRRSRQIRHIDQPSSYRSTTHLRSVSFGSSSGYHPGIRGHPRRGT